MLANVIHGTGRACRHGGARRQSRLPAQIAGAATMTLPRTALLLAPLLGLLAGCSLIRVGDDQRHEALARVAKDWSAVIRASQVVPVYPLTEDLRPGDLFLVQTTVDRQHEIYRRKGYLPLDHHFDRLSPDGYARFYEQPPGRPPASDAAGWWRGQQGWEQAPLVGFPSYGFSLSKGGGLDLAIPLAAASVGLSLVGADEASGSVSLRRAYTYGVGIDALAAQVQAWNGRADAARRRLSPYASKDGCGASDGQPSCNYLRVVNRVFLVQEVDVAISARRSNDASITARLSAAGLLGGVGAAVAAAPGTAVRGAAGVVDRVGDRLAPNARPDGVYAHSLRTLNRALAGDRSAAATLDRVAKPVGTIAGRTLAAVGGALPDGALPLPKVGVTVRSFSDRSIAMSEAFERPLVIGYLAFDMQILEDGVLGAPVPTFAVLEDSRVPPAERAAQFEAVFDYDRLLDLDLPRCPAADAILTAAVVCLGPDWSTAWAAKLDTRRKPPGRSGKQVHPVTAFRAVAKTLRAAGKLGPPVSGLPAHCPAAAGAAFEIHVARLLGPSAERCAITSPLR